MKLYYSLLSVLVLSIILISACKNDDPLCTETLWYQDADGDGLGNPDVSFSSCEAPTGYVANDDDTDDDDTPCAETLWYQDADADGLGNPDVSLSSCEQPEGYVANDTDDDDTSSGSTELHAAFSEFDTENFSIYLEDDEVVLETNGLPNHTSPYWSNTTERTAVDPMGNTLVTPAAAENHPLFVEPTLTSHEMMAPGNIDDFNGSYTLRVPVSPQLASSSTATGLGAIGFAVSGSMIYNDEEGPNVPLDNAVGSLDYTAAHTGPQSYHYHLETKAWSDDDDKLIGIISDGFFLYGRRDYDGSYPTDLDASGGHFGPTPHNPDGEYHYHIQNVLYLNSYYILFPGDYQGTPNNIQ